MSKSVFNRPRHKIVQKALALFQPRFLERSHCYFGGGTRIVLALHEYRESEDLDFLCSSRDGYRALRSTVTSASLGKIASGLRKISSGKWASRHATIWSERSGRKSNAKQNRSKR